MEKVWLKSYPKGVPEYINLSVYDSLGDAFEKAVRKFTDKTAYVNMGKELSFNDIDRLSAAFGSYLQHELKLPVGSKVALMMPNILQYPIALFGALRAGYVVVNCNPLYTPRELEYQLIDSESQAIIIVENFCHVLQQVVGKTALRKVIVTGLGDMLGPMKSHVVNFVVRNVKKMVPSWSINGHIRLKEVLAIGATHKFAPVNVTREDIAFLQYTGGTTGVSKGAMLTHGNIIANQLQATAWLGELIQEGKEYIITALPLYHIFSLTANALVYFNIGARNLLITNPRDIPGFVKELQGQKFTTMSGVNTLFNALVHNEDFAKLDFSHLKVVLGGGAAVHEAVAKRWREVTGVPLIQAYGLTETSPAATINPIDDRPFNGSTGLPLPSTEVLMRDDDGNNLAVGEIGELCVRGPQVMKGYWKRQDETDKVIMIDGFLRTGDIGRMDENGFCFIVDRKKDMILVSGFNVYPNEIEDVVVKLDGVIEAAVIGVPDAEKGEAVKVFIVAKDNSLTKEKVIAHCRQFLTGYKVPSHVQFMKELPKTNVGKILRRELRDK